MGHEVQAYLKFGLWLVQLTVNPVAPGTWRLWGFFGGNTAQDADCHKHIKSVMAVPFGSRSANLTQFQEFKIYCCGEYSVLFSTIKVPRKFFFIIRIVFPQAGQNLEVRHG